MTRERLFDLEDERHAAQKRLWGTRETLMFARERLGGAAAGAIVALGLGLARVRVEAFARGLYEPMQDRDAGEPAIVLPVRCFYPGGPIEDFWAFHAEDPTLVVRRTARTDFIRTWTDESRAIAEELGEVVPPPLVFGAAWDFVLAVGRATRGRTGVGDLPPMIAPWNPDLVGWLDELEPHSRVVADDEDFAGRLDKRLRREEKARRPRLPEIFMTEKARAA